MAKNQLTVAQQMGLSKPGDKLEAKITQTNREVVKVSTNNGYDKYSATRYSNGTVVETKTTKK
jgi:hypothetical protein